MLSPGEVISYCMECHKYKVDGVYVTVPPFPVLPEQVSHGYCPQCAPIIKARWDEELKQLKGNKS